jgi:transcriptional regulator with XRE-family HTH domain
MTNDASHTATKIRALRKQAGLTQAEAAKAAEMNRVTWTMIESGKRKIATTDLDLIAQALGVSQAELLGNALRLDVKLPKGKAKPQPASPVLRIDVPQRKLDKFRELLIYILERVGARPNVGETVLYKLLYFMDFDYYEKYEEQLVGATYIKMPYGPAPAEFKDIVQGMLDKDLVLVKSRVFDHAQKKYLPTRTANLKLFSGQELEHVERVLRKLGHMNARQISEYSHGDVPWLTTEDNQPIPYEKVFYRTDPYTARCPDAPSL